MLEQMLRDNAITNFKTKYITKKQMAKIVNGTKKFIKLSTFSTWQTSDHISLYLYMERKKEIH